MLNKQSSILKQYPHIFCMFCVVRRQSFQTLISVCFSLHNIYPHLQLNSPELSLGPKLQSLGNNRCGKNRRIFWNLSLCPKQSLISKIGVFQSWSFKALSSHNCAVRNVIELKVIYKNANAMGFRERITTTFCP